MGLQPDPVLQESFRYAEQITRRSGSSFHLSFLLLPRQEYRAMCVLYAYMRLTDDLADEDDEAGNAACDQRLAQLCSWRRQTLECLQEGKDQHPLHPALRLIASRYQIRPDWLTGVIDGAEFDLSPQVIETEAEFKHYCYLVAGTVGLCCQAIWGADLDRTHDLAILCGEAFQRTNILRDLKEDSQRGRCYLPRQVLEARQLSPEQIASSGESHKLLPLIDEQIRLTRACYQQAGLLDACLQGAGRRMFRVMFATYRQLLEKIAQEPARILTERVRLTRPQRLTLLLTAPFVSPR